MNDKPPIKLEFSKLSRPPQILDGDISTMPDIPWHPSPQSPERQLLEALKDLGVVFPDDEKALKAIEDGFDIHGDCRAADALCAIIARLPDTKAGLQLRLALLNATATESNATKLGITRQTLAVNLERLKKRLRTSH